MFADELKRAIEAAPRCRLPDVAKALWSALADGQIDETEAEILSGMIDARRTQPASNPARKKVGTRPRSPASIERRRRWAASGALPVGLAARFTISEQAVLAVVAGEVRKHGRCTLFVGHIAALAGVGETTVRNTLREAQRLGLVAVEVRRVTAWRNDANIVSIISPEWTMWLARVGRGGGCKSALGTVSGSTTAGGDAAADRRTGYRKEGAADGGSSPRHPLRSREKTVQGARRLGGYLVPDLG